MRSAVILLAGVLLAGSQEPLARAHEAIGGAAHIAAVRGLTLSGVTLPVASELRGPEPHTGHPIEFRIAFPDKYVRLRGETRYGFNGRTPIHVYPPPPPGARVLRTPPNWIEEQTYPLARWLLGIFADTKGVMPVSITASSSDTNVLVVSGPKMKRATGPDRFAALIDLDPGTGMPLRVRYRDDLWIAEPITPEQIAAGRPARGRVEDVEVVITFEDRRLVDGLMLPHRIVRTVKGVTWEDVRFDSIKVNPVFTGADFR